MRSAVSIAAVVAVTPADEVIGHVLGTRGHVGQDPVVALGPLAVRPDRQKNGVGSALMHAVLGAADALGEPLVALLGDPAYCRGSRRDTRTQYPLVALPPHCRRGVGNWCRGSGIPQGQIRPGTTSARKLTVTTDTCPARGEAAGRSAGEGLRDSSVTQECSQNRRLARRSSA